MAETPISEAEKKYLLRAADAVLRPGTHAERKVCLGLVGKGFLRVPEDEPELFEITEAGETRIAHLLRGRNR